MQQYSDIQGAVACAMQQYSDIQGAAATCEVQQQHARCSSSGGMQGAAVCTAAVREVQQQQWHARCSSSMHSSSPRGAPTCSAAAGSARTQAQTSCSDLRMAAGSATPSGRSVEAGKERRSNWAQHCSISAGFAASNDQHIAISTSEALTETQICNRGLPQCQEPGHVPRCQWCTVQ